MSNPRHQQARIRRFTAETDLRTNKFHVVKVGTAQEDVELAGAGEGDGILMNSPNVGEDAEVAMVGGGALGHSGAAVARGDYVAADAAGKLVPAAAGNRVVGKALSPAAGADEYFEIERVEFVHP